MISECRRKRAKALKQETDALRCLAAGFLLAVHLKIDEKDFIVNQYGKPYLPDASLYFNVTHGGNFAALTISDREIGIDIEPKGRYAEAVIRRVFTDEEIHTLLNRESFARLWTAKEAVMKACGKGLALNPKSFCALEGKAFADNRHWRIESLEHEGHTVSVAIEEKA